MRRSLGVIAAGHTVTAEAAEHMLRAGGNAYDAVLAGMCAACAAEPVLASPGGGGFLRVTAVVDGRTGSLPLQP